MLDVSYSLAHYWHESIILNGSLLGQFYKRNYSIFPQSSQCRVSRFQLASRPSCVKVHPSLHNRLDSHDSIRELGWTVRRILYIFHWTQFNSCSQRRNHDDLLIQTCQLDSTLCTSIPSARWIRNCASM